MTQHKTHKLYVNKMHCNACVVLTESELGSHPKVQSARSNLRTRSVEICGNFGDMALEDIAKELSKVLSEHSLSAQDEKQNIKWGEFRTAIPIAVGFILFFLLLQKFGIVNLVKAGNVSYGTAFMIGIIASLFVV